MLLYIDANDENSGEVYLCNVMASSCSASDVHELLYDRYQLTSDDVGCLKKPHVTPNKGQTSQGEAAASENSLSIIRLGEMAFRNDGRGQRYPERHYIA